MKIALCLLTWNEIDGVRHDVPMIDRSKFDQIYCIDGGSTDGTVEYLESAGIPVHRQSAKGLNQACWDGAEKCECDAFVFFHPKGTIPVEDTCRFRAFFEIIIHERPRGEAEEYLRQLQEFYEAGWMRIIVIELKYVHRETGSNTILLSSVKSTMASPKLWQTP